MKINEIRSKVLNKEWQLPIFQREYVWNNKFKIISFLESIFNEWPIGSIIIWSPQEQLEEERTLETRSDGTPIYPKEYIIDGQQRITTLLRVLNNEPFVFKGEEYYPMYDFESDNFFFFKQREVEKDKELFINRLFLKDIFDKRHSEIKEDLDLDRIKFKNFIFYEFKDKSFSQEQLLEIAKEKFSLDEKNFNDLFSYLYKEENKFVKIKDSNLFYIKENITDDLLDIDDTISKLKRMKEYDINVLYSRNLSPKQAQTLFIRLNTGGKTLPSVDLALAYISLLWADVRDEFKNFKATLEGKGFYFDVDFFVRCLSAVSLNQSLTKNLIENFKEDTIREDWFMTKSSIEKTVDFLRSVLNLNSNIFLEAKNSLVPIVVLFSRREDKVKDKIYQLAYWFLVSYINKRFSGQSTAVLNRDIKLILHSKDPISALIQNLKEERQKLHLQPEDISGGHFKFILYYLFRQMGTKDLITHFNLDSTPAHISNKLDFHHIFPDSLLKRTRFKDKKDHIANKTFLINKSNKKLSNSDPTYLNSYPEEILKNHLIPLNKNLWQIEKYDLFLKARRRLISNKLNEVLDRLLKTRY